MRRRSEEAFAESHAGSLDSVPVFKPRSVTGASDRKLNCFLLGHRGV